MRATVSSLLGMLGAVICASTLSAAGTATIEFDTYQDFLKGKASNTAIDSDGTIRLAQAISEAGPVSESIIWCVTSDAAGNLFLGTGFDGRVIKISADGKSSTFLDTEETHVTALAFDSTGTLYAATSPNGKIYAVSAAGKEEVFIKTEDKYVWAMVFDASGTLYAATGDRGLIRKITKAREASTFFSSADANITALAIDGAGNILAGGDTRGALYRISPTGKALAIWSSDLKEIRSIIPMSDGTTLVAAGEGRRDAEPLPQPRATTQQTQLPGGVQAEVTTTVESESAGGIVFSAPATAVKTAPERKPRGALVQVRQDGSSRELWRSEEDGIHTAVDAGDGRTIIGTGNRGRLYWVDGAGRSGLAAELDGEQCSAMVRYGKDRVVCAVNNRAGVYRMSSAVAAQGTFTSSVQDAGWTAAWGTARWIARGSGVSITTRTGNTPQPDTTWSDWSPPLKKAGGEQIASPAGRYMQWKAVFGQEGGAGGAVLDAAYLNYRQWNSPPRIGPITVAAPGDVYQKSFSTGEGELLGLEDPAPKRNRNEQTGAAAPVQATPTGKKLYEQGMQTFLWTADDPNGDEISYSLYFKLIGESAWKSIKNDYRQPALVIDTSSLPDGAYRLKVEASDERSNPKSAAQKSERESAVFVVDNTPPRVSAPVAGGAGWIVVVSDGASPIAAIEYATNAGPWQTAYPRDGICDGLEEQVEVPRAAAGQLVVLKVTDARGNFTVYPLGQ